MAGPVVAVMQPYFMPYAGYWRLLAQADVLVLFDCVQFPRRGYVHRNRLPRGDGVLDWLTLPLAPAAFDVRIDALRFADDAPAQLRARAARFPSLSAPEPLADALLAPAAARGGVADYLHRQIVDTGAALGLRPEVLRSSSLRLDDGLRGQERVLEIARRLGAAAYLNSPGGRDLYDAETFAAAGVELRFLPPWTGEGASLLHLLATRSAAEIAAAIRG